MITQEYLKSRLVYDPETGSWTWKPFAGQSKRWNSRWAGTRSDGYLQIRIDDVLYYGHRLAFLYMTGAIPAEIDHIDVSPWNSKWSNLRAADRHGNNANKRCWSKHGLKGIYSHNKKWCAHIGRNGQHRYLGIFETKEAAHAAYCKAAEELHGEFARAA